MSVDRPTFSESWYQVAELKPRLRTAVRTYRQNFRGKTWHVISDGASNQFFRLDEPAYYFVALLNGTRSVADAWEITNQQLGDEAPTQGEVVRLLGQLFTSNLLHADLPPATGPVFERYRKRVRREVTGYLMNFMFARIPLFDPQRILDRFVGVVGWIFGPVGVALWALLLAVAGWHLTGRGDELWNGPDSQALLKTENLIWLYLCFTVVKIIHEFGHGFACAYFGRKSGVHTPVHTLGVMLLVLMPVPYVDASSSWALRNKWHRAFVGAAGMYVELAVAAVAALVWSYTDAGTLTHTLAYNVMFIASVATLLFNANPLLRFDGYYILSDLFEIANLAQRSKQYLYYLVRRYAYGVERAVSPERTRSEKIWMTVYGIASAIYRVFICFSIVLFVANFVLLVAALMVIGAVWAWGVMPAFKWGKYLLSSPELVRTRSRAVWTTAGFFAALIGVLGFIPMPDRGRAEGVVEPLRLTAVHAEADGFIDSVLPSGRAAGPNSPPLVRAHNPALESEARRVQARLNEALVRREKARTQDVALVQALGDQVASLRQMQQRAHRDLASLVRRAEHEGVWFCPKHDRLAGTFVRRGERLGLLADPSQLIIRVSADQELGPRIEPEVGTGPEARVEMRLQGRPGVWLEGEVRRVIPAGQRQLPSAALGYVAGGSLSVAQDDPEGKRTAEPFFEVHIEPHLDTLSQDVPLHIGQRVMVRFDTPAKPLLVQWWRSLRQLFQRRLSARPDQA